MIKGVHTMFYSSDAPATRAFLRDILGFPCTDAGEGWLIFDLPEVEIGCHPLERDNGAAATPGACEVAFYCDDLHATVAELRGRGVAFVDAIADVGYGLATRFAMPGGVVVQLYQPHYRQRPRSA